MFETVSVGKLTWSVTGYDSWPDTRKRQIKCTETEKGGET